MKKIKIFGLPSHQSKDRTSGVDFARVIQPLKALNGYKDSEVEFETTLFDINESVEKMDWLEVAKNYDIIFLNYILNPWGYAALGAMARAHGVKIVLDLDDNLWEIRQDNPAYTAFQKGSKGIHDFTCIVNDVDMVTTTTNYLKNVVINKSNKGHNQITTIDNFIDLENIYNHKLPFKDTEEIRIAHHGSTTHFEDLISDEFIKGIDQIMSEFPQVTLEFIGAFIPRYRMRWGKRYINSFGATDFYKWSKERFPELLKEVDITITPLQNNVYTRCKSRIKFLENSSVSKPGVYQKMQQYQNEIIHGQNGYLATTAEEWYNSLKELIVDKEKRKKVGQTAFDSIQDKTIQKNISQYAEMFKSGLDK